MQNQIKLSRKVHGTLKLLLPAKLGVHPQVKA